MFAEARSLLEDERFSDAFSSFNGMSKVFPSSFAVHINTAICAFALLEWRTASSCIRKAIKIKPQHEYASRLLFASLWYDGQQDEAYKELERFIAVVSRYTGEYDLMLRDLRDEITSEEYNEIAKRLEAKRGE